MKSIENSIEKEHLMPNSLLSEELEKGMAGCGLVSTNNKNTNGQCTTDLKLIQKFDVEDILSVNKTVLMASGSDYLEDISDDEFELAIEASSDECESSPIKKEEIVEEIRNILGIKNGSIETEDELEEKILENVGSVTDDIVENVCLKSQNEINVTNITLNNEPVHNTSSTNNNVSQEEKNMSKTLPQCNSLSDTKNSTELQTCNDSEKEKSTCLTNATEINNACENAAEEIQNESLSINHGNNTHRDNDLAVSEVASLSGTPDELTVVDYVGSSDENLTDKLTLNKNITEIDSNPEKEPDSDGSRKRAASIDDEEEQFKKQKLDIDGSDLLEGKSLKRSLPNLEINENKRSKSCVELDVQKPGLLTTSEVSTIIDHCSMDNVENVEEDLLLQSDSSQDPLDKLNSNNKQLESKLETFVTEKSHEENHGCIITPKLTTEDLVVPTKEVDDILKETIDKSPNEKSRNSIEPSSHSNNDENKLLGIKKPDILPSDILVIEDTKDQVTLLNEDSKTSDRSLQVLNENDLLKNNSTSVELRCAPYTSEAVKLNDSSFDIINIKEVKNQDDSQFDSEHKRVGSKTQVLNFGQERIFSKEKNEARASENVLNKIIVPNNRSDKEDDKVDISSPNLNDNKGQSVNNVCKITSDSDKSYSNVSHDSSEDKEHPSMNEREEVDAKDAACKDLTVQDASKVDEEACCANKPFLLDNTLKAPPSKQDPCNKPNKNTVAEVINRLEKPNQLDKDKVVKNSNTKAANFTYSEDSVSIHDMENTKNTEDTCTKECASLVLNKNSDDFIYAKDASSQGINSNCDLSRKSISITESDKESSNVDLPSILLEKENNVLNQDGKISNEPYGSQDDKNQCLVKPTCLKEIVDEIRLSNVEETRVNEDPSPLENNEKGENKADVVDDQYLSKEINNLAQKFDLADGNSSNSKIRSSPFQVIEKNLQKKLQSKSMSNLDLAIESVVEKSRRNTEKSVPLLTKFHKDKLRKMTRSELEEAVVLKICEAISDRSELGQLRLRVQNLEQNNELWRKKAIQCDKQNRELEMVVKRFLTESAQIKRDNQSKVPHPIRVTRSVGLQVVLASSVSGGTLVSSKRKSTQESTKSQSKPTSSQSRLQSSQQQQPHPQILLPKRTEKEPVKEPQKRVPFSPPVRCNSSANNPTISTRGRDAQKQAQSNSASSSAVSRTSTPVTHIQASSSSAPSTPQPSPVKISNPTIAPKPLNTLTPQKSKHSSSKDMEVIDLTDREEKSKASPQPAGPSIRVNPSTQVRFVQQSPGSAPAQQMYALVQKSVQRQQFLVTTTSASSPLSGLQPQSVMAMTSQPSNTISTVPVFRTGGGQLIPVQASSVNVKSQNPGNKSVLPVPPTIRTQHQIKVLTHPAPLPTAPQPVIRIGTKAPPPRPTLKIAKTTNGIMLSWSMNLTKDLAEMSTYQLYAYQEANQPPSTSLWKKVGDVKALPLPMACTLTQFIEGHKYHFAVRAVDIHGRIGPFSHPGSILLRTDK